MRKKNYLMQADFSNQTIMFFLTAKNKLNKLKHI